MFNTILLVLNIIIASINFSFILICLKSKFEKHFHFFGLSTISLCLFSMTDTWFIPNAVHSEDKNSIIFWTIFGHNIIITLYFPLVSIYTSKVLSYDLRKALLPVAVSCSLSLLLSTQSHSFFSLSSSYSVETSNLYDILITPYIIIYMIYCIKLSINGYQKSSNYKRFFLYHLIAISILFLFGLIDLSITIGIQLFGTISYTSIGLVAYGCLTTYAFLERFMSIIQEKEVLARNLKRAYRETTESKTLQQIGESTARINHELKNYLAIIQNHIPRIRKKFQQYKIPENLESLDNASQRMLVLCDNILELSRQPDSSSLPILNLQTSIEKCLEQNFSEHASVFKVLSPPLAIRIHHEKWEQVLINLFNNALEAHATRVLIETQTFQKSVILSIRDNGEGCLPKDKPHLFQAFFTTRKVTGGTGLGLNIVKTIVENAGGDISLYSRYPHGMELNITFPNPNHSQKLLKSTSSYKSHTPSVQLWAKSQPIIQRARRICERLQISLDIMPIEHWSTESISTITGESTFLVELPTFEKDEKTQKNKNAFTEKRVFSVYWEEEEVYVDGDALSEFFLTHQLAESQNKMI